MHILNEFIEKINKENLKVVVVGDCMYDDYYQVEANRISPEFPIAVMKSEDENPTYRYPGGAANVAFQLSNFNVDTYLVSLLECWSNPFFEEYDINAAFSYFSNEIKLPVKKRLYNGDFPLCRWDIEKENYGLPDDKLWDIQKSILENVKNLQPDVVILSDYGKGIFKNVSGKSSVNGNYSKEMWIFDVDTGEKRPWITVVDPKNDDLIEWEGCTVFKPNVSEAKKLTGKTDDFEQVKHIKKVLNCESVVVTHGGDKVVGMDKKEWMFYGGHKGEAKYPIGAGDCFIAMLSVAYLLFEPQKAAEIAFELGAIYVNTKNRRINPNNILGNNSKIKTPEEIRKEILNCSGETFAICNGVYDIIHSGHMELLKFAKSKADKVIVALNDDDSVKRLKGPTRPKKPLEQRMKVMECLESVDYVTSFSEDTPLEIIKIIKPDCIVKGTDYKKEDVVGYEEVKGHVYLCPLFDNQSTSLYVN